MKKAFYMEYHEGSNFGWGCWNICDASGNRVAALDVSDFNNKDEAEQYGRIMMDALTAHFQ